MAALTMDERFNYGMMLPYKNIEVFLVRWDGEFKLMLYHEIVGFRIFENDQVNDIRFPRRPTIFNFINNYLNGNMIIYGVGQLENLTYNDVYQLLQSHAADYANNEKFYGDTFDDIVNRFGTKPQPIPGVQLRRKLNAIVETLQATAEGPEEEADVARITAELKNKHPGIF